MEHVGQDSVSPNSSKRNWIKVLVLCAASLFFVFFFLRVLFYGGIEGAIHGCEYTEVMVPIPDVLIGASIYMESGAYLVQGPPMHEECGDVQGTTPMFVNEETVDNITVGAKYFEDRGKVVQRYEGERRFTLRGIIAKHKHGLSTVDSGGGPLYRLVLVDGGGKEYRVNTVALPVMEQHIQEGDLVLTYQTPQMTTPGLLTWSYFEDSLR